MVLLLEQNVVASVISGLALIDAGWLDVVSGLLVPAKLKLVLWYSYIYIFYHSSRRVVSYNTHIPNAGEYTPLRVVCSVGTNL